MQISFHGFGATRALSGYTLEVAEMSSIAAIKKILISSIQQQEKYAGLAEILIATALASDDQVFNDDEIISKNTTINLLPPVCGG